MRAALFSPAGTILAVAVSLASVTSSVAQTSQPSSQSTAAQIEVIENGEVQTWTVLSGGNTPAVSISGHVRIRGNGRDEALLKGPEEGAAFSIKAGATLEISGLSLTAHSSSTTVFVDGGTLILEDCFLATDAEVLIEISSGVLQISDCQLSGKAFGLFAHDGSRVTIDGTDFHGFSNTALFVSESTVGVSESRVSGPGQNGLTATNGASVNIRGLELLGLEGIGLFLKSGASAAVEGMVMDGPFENGVFAAGAEQVELHGLTTTGKVMLPVNVLDATEVRITGGNLASAGKSLAITNVPLVTVDGGAKLLPGRSAEAAYFDNLGLLKIESIEVEGGRIGLFIGKDVAEYRILDSAITDQEEYSVVANAPREGGALVRGNRIRIKRGTAVYAGAGAGLELRENVVVAHGDSPAIQLAPGSGAEVISNTLVTRNPEDQATFAGQNQVVATEPAKTEGVGQSAVGSDDANGERVTLESSERIPDVFRFVLRRDDGSFANGPVLTLKPRSALQAVLRNLRPEPVFSRFARRLGVDGLPHLPLARERLKDLSAIVPSVRDWEDSLQILIYSDIVANFGSELDVVWLHDNLFATDPRVAAAAMVALEQRLGTLAGGNSLTFAMQALDAGRVEEAAFLAEPLLRTGLPEAIALAPRIRRGLQTAQSGQFSSSRFGLIEQVLAGDQVSISDLQNLLKEQSVEIRDGLSRETFYGGAGKQDAIFAALYLTALSPDALREIDLPIQIPVPRAGYTVYGGFSSWDLALISADPVQLVDFQTTDFLGNSTASERWSWELLTASVACGVIPFFEGEEQNNQYSRAFDRLALAVRVPDFETRPNYEHAGLMQLAARAVDAAAAECIPAASLVSKAMNDSMKEDLLTEVPKRPRFPWWVKPAQLLANVNRAYDLSTLEEFGSYSDQVFEAAVSNSQRGEDVKQAMILHHRLLTGAFQPKVNRFNRLIERRLFRISGLKPGESGTLSVAGMVDFRPINGTDGLTLAVRHHIFAQDSGGISAQMSEGEYAAFETPDRRAMFRRIILDTSAGQTELEYQRSGPDNVLVFSAPVSAGPDSVVHVEMQYADMSWSFALPLYQVPHPWIEANGIHEE